MKKSEVKTVEVPTINKIIKELRKKGYTLTELAKIIGVSLSCVSLYANDKRNNQYLERVIKLLKLYDFAEKGEIKHVKSVITESAIDGESVFYKFVAGTAARNETNKHC